jgi:hypothetical protein
VAVKQRELLLEILFFVAQRLGELDSAIDLILEMRKLFQA